MIRKIIAFCVILLLLVGGTFSVHAEELELDAVGSISVTLTEQNEPIVGAELSVYYVAEVHSDSDGDLSYDYTDNFKQFDAKLDDNEIALKLEQFLSNRNLPSIKMITDEEGNAFFDQLDLGLYFVMQTNIVDGYAPCTPFIVTVPNVKDGEYIYDVNATPKTEVEKSMSITIKKVWNTDSSTKAANSVTVRLLKNGEVVKTAVLNENNNWQITYDNLPKSDAYSIEEVNIPKGFTATYKQEENVFTVTNSSTLIQTGQLIWPIPVLAGSGMLLIALGFVLLHKKRKANA